MLVLLGFWLNPRWDPALPAPQSTPSLRIRTVGGWLGGPLGAGEVDFSLPGNRWLGLSVGPLWVEAWDTSARVEGAPEGDVVNLSRGGKLFGFGLTYGETRGPAFVWGKLSWALGARRLEAGSEAGSVWPEGQALSSELRGALLGAGARWAWLGVWAEVWARSQDGPWQGDGDTSHPFIASQMDTLGFPPMFGLWAFWGPLRLDLASVGDPWVSLWCGWGALEGALIWHREPGASLGLRVPVGSVRLSAFGLWLGGLWGGGLGVGYEVP